MNNSPVVCIIVAMSKNGVIGNKETNDLPWRLPDDLKFFKSKTLHTDVIMGRKTFDSLGGKPLKDRNNIILTKNRAITDKYNNDVKSLLSPEEYDERWGKNTAWLNSLERAVTVCKAVPGVEELFIIGGAAIFEEARKLPVSCIVERLYVTEVDCELHGDQYVKFHFDPLIWKEVSREHHEKDEKHEYAFDFVRYDRVVNIIDI